MRHENENPAKRRRLAALSTIVVVVLVVVAATVVGPGKAIDWLVNYLIPVGVITGVIIASLALLSWAFKRHPDLWHWWGQ